MQQTNTQKLLDNLLEKLNYFQVEKVITSSPSVKFELTKRIEELKIQVTKVRECLQQGKEITDTTSYQDLYSILQAAPEKLDTQKFEKISQNVITNSKNIVSNSTINAGGNVHIGDIINNNYNSEQKKQDTTMADFNQIKKWLETEEYSKVFVELDKIYDDISDKTTYNRLKKEHVRDKKTLDYDDRIATFINGIKK